MTIRTTTKSVSFQRPFAMKGSDHLYPAGAYEVVTDEELIDGLSFLAYRRVSTMMFVPTAGGSSIEMITIDPADLADAQLRDAIVQTPKTFESAH